MTFAIVKVLPLPVTPIRVVHLLPEAMDPHICAIASGWSPVGL